MNKRAYQICTTCIMDTSDSSIIFNEQGVCEYCTNFSTHIVPNWHTNEKGEKQLKELAIKIKQQGKGKDFDCILGLSGGLDSSYTAYVVKEVMGLRPLLLHVDAGWNTDQAVGNIEKLVDGLGLDLYTEVIDWEQMKSVQRAFLNAQIPDQDLPQDAAFFSGLYMFAKKYKIKYILTGSNYSTECCREPREWGGYSCIDKTLFNDIYKKFTGKNIKGFPLVDILKYKGYYKYVLGMKIAYPLNFVPYLKKDAEVLLNQRFGWQPFPHKHHESRFTRFIEEYWLPVKFGYEKKRAHFSSLIMTGQLSREEALEKISKSTFDSHWLAQEFEYIANKLDLSIEALRAIFENKNQTYRNFKNKMFFITAVYNATRIFNKNKKLIK